MLISHRSFACEPIIKTRHYPGAIRKRMFDNRLNLRPHRGHATRVMHLYHHRHGSSIEAVPYRKHQSSAGLSSLPSPQPRGPSAVGGRHSGWFVGKQEVRAEQRVVQEG
jgi:hypothetical protein